MATSLAASATAGAIFGSALTLSGVYSPWIILSQMQNSNFHMLQTFLTASGCSTIAMILARRYGIAPCPPRSPTALGTFPYDGNIIGGLLLGTGMTLTGACPGTVLVQIATGIRSGYFSFLGGILGGTMYGMVKPFLSSNSRNRGAGVTAAAVKDEPRTVQQYVGMREERLVLIYEGFLVLVLMLASLTERADNVLFPPVVGGFLIGVGQVASLVLTRSAVGVSSAYEQLGGATKRAWGYMSGGGKDSGPQPAYNSVVFAGGVVFGSWVLSLAVDLKVPGGDAPIADSTAILGGLIMVLGARVAGGCTSGHGISGMSTFSIASIISVAAMFTGGMGLALLM
ncbi:hypothetical protein ONS95_011015 [Cadophora gregata]|uniref:uncharacterized protein n=1 Tax=Cadophora gregata TaxID=51156 RepID=UPI0026DB0FA0|nr:uncharacterized protein ONS95_011015 [Cadophora gregata]KAK0119575.1 hypothetical protein ONS95_011015 [Cadophora gregata]KAK0120611.1 hypothetical protein ONS96_010815 [Cadophora gregata f. sp. sojae]